jgi:hypothetical protein
MEDWLVYLNGYYYDVVHLAARTEDSEEVLHAMRKVAALAVACMEQFGGFDMNSTGDFSTFYPGPIPQNLVWNMISQVRNRRPVAMETINEYILRIGHLLDTAIDQHVGKASGLTLQTILLMAVEAYRCMEYHGSPRRVY